MIRSPLVRHDGSQELLKITRTGHQRPYEVVRYEGVWVRKFTDGGGHEAIRISERDHPHTGVL